MSRHHDRQITIFSPEGKLYQIEYAIKAVQQNGLLGICLRGKDSVCVVSQKKVSDKLMDRDHVTNTYKITKGIGCLAIGRVPDCKALIQEARNVAAQFKDENGYDIPVHFLAQRIGKKNQIWTQKAGRRPYACTIHLAAIDDEKGAQLWKVDPSGHFFGWKASAIGPKDQEASNALEKVLKKTNGVSDENETIRKCIDCLQVVLAQDLKAADVEVGVACTDADGQADFKLLSDAEVDDHLTAIHEQD